MVSRFPDARSVVHLICKDRKEPVPLQQDETITLHFMRIVYYVIGYVLFFLVYVIWFVSSISIHLM